MLARGRRAEGIAGAFTVDLTEPGHDGSDDTGSDLDVEEAAPGGEVFTVQNLGGSEHGESDDAAPLGLGGTLDLRAVGPVFPEERVQHVHVHEAAERALPVLVGERLGRAHPLPERPPLAGSEHDLAHHAVGAGDVGVHRTVTGTDDLRRATMALAVVRIGDRPGVHLCEHLEGRDVEVLAAGAPVLVEECQDDRIGAEHPERVVGDRSGNEEGRLLRDAGEGQPS